MGRTGEGRCTGPPRSSVPVSLGSPPPRRHVSQLLHLTLCLVPVYSSGSQDPDSQAHRPQVQHQPCLGRATPGVACMDSGCGGIVCGAQVHGGAGTPDPSHAQLLAWSGVGGTQAQGNPSPPAACFPTVQAQGPPPHCRQELGPVHWAALGCDLGQSEAGVGRGCGEGGRPPPSAWCPERIPLEGAVPTGASRHGPALISNTGANQTGARPKLLPSRGRERPTKRRRLRTIAP